MFGVKGRGEGVVFAKSLTLTENNVFAAPTVISNGMIKGLVNYKL